MTEEQMIKTINVLLLTASAFLFYGLMYYVTDQLPDMAYQKDRQEAKREVVIPEVPKREPNPVIVAESELRNSWNNVVVTYTSIEYDYLGRYFITAYSDEETWSRATASGVEVHYSEDRLEPTTCAIDRNYHRFGEYLAVGDGSERKIYVTEDTGTFRGLWIDCFVETMEEVQTFNTRYDNVYSVEFVEHRISINERKKKHEWFNNYLHRGCVGSWIPYRCEC